MSELMMCSIFMESITNICWPWRTASPSSTRIWMIVPWSGEAIASVPGGPTMLGAGCAPGVIVATPCPALVPEPSRK